MKLQQIQSVKPNSQNQTSPQNNNSNVAFKGLGMIAAQGLRFLDTNQAWGANAVDLGCMVLPRTATDFTRGPEAGFETLRREASGTVNHSLVGAYGLGAAYLLSQRLNKDFGIKAHKLLANDESIVAFGEIHHEQLKANGNDAKKALHNSVDKFIEGLEGFNPEKNTAGGYVKLGLDKNSKTRSQIVKLIENAAEISTDQPTLKRSVAAKKLINRKLKYAERLIVAETGVESNYRFIHGKTKVTSSLSEMLGSFCKLSKTFMSEKVGKEFSTTSNIAENMFLKRLKTLNTRTSLIGIGAAALIGCNIQPINMYLTKKKTGKSDFVGGGEPDHSNKFKALKTLAAAAFGGLVLLTIKPAGAKDLLKKIQFKGFTPTMDQFKVVYGMTIMSRLLVARNKNELRESSFKDSLGFLNWMVLGSFVGKGTAMAFEKYAKLDNKTFLRYNETEHGKGWFNKLTKSNLITRDEVLISALKDAGIATVEKGKALPYKALLQTATENAAKSAKLASALKKIKLITAAQLIGYVYSGVVLGWGIPKLNIAITKNMDKKEEAKKKEILNNPANLAFLSNKTQSAKSFINQ